MIPVNELRIGSYYNYNNMPIKLDGSFLAMYLQNDTDLYLHPITLTEEWLLKFGFVKTDGYGFNMFGNWIQKQDGIFWYNVNGNFVELKHLHQLQKLYFALTGKELKLC